MPKVFNRFALCFFDVLGFESKFQDIGLAGMLEKYGKLVSTVHARNASTKRLFNQMEVEEGAYWSSGGDAFVFSRLYGAYASDSILVWAHADFPCNRYPEALELTPEERIKRASVPSEGWKYQTVPCDNFLDLCNEILCQSVEIGLPLRGALAMGEGVFHLDSGVYMGLPLIEAARMESEQRFIGASCLDSFMQQFIPKRYFFPFTDHLKSQSVEHYSGSVIDWPRHWRATRKADIRQTIRQLDTKASASAYYENTLRLIDASEEVGESRGPSSGHLVRGVYPQFSSEDLLLSAMAVRRIPVSNLPEG